ncbi:MAG: hypothetical protein LBO69_05425 [Ignavibacteria bacterium]|jgi:hypothetical protein|nr:hypothetical protein [Ignavibacteria bacterium]
MASEQVIEIIRQTCDEINATTPLMLAIASAETGGKFTTDGSNAKYAGVFQLASGYGGCVGTDRLDVARATKCTWLHIQQDKANFINTQGVWEDWFAYCIHQQGLAGFKEIYRNRNNKLSSLSSARQNEIKGNLPDSISKNIVYVSEYLDYWKTRINGLVEQYSEHTYTIELSQSIIQNINLPLDLANCIISNQSVLITLAVIIGGFCIVKLRNKK